MRDRADLIRALDDLVVGSLRARRQVACYATLPAIKHTLRATRRALALVAQDVQRLPPHYGDDVFHVETTQRDLDQAVRTGAPHDVKR